MAIVASCVCLFIFLVSKRICKKWINPVACLSALWGVIFFLNSIKLYNLNVAEDSTILIMLMGVIAFSFGFFIWSEFKKRYSFIIRKNKNVNNQRYIYIPNYYVLYILCIIIILMNLPNLINSLSLLLNGKGLDQIRYLMQNSTTSNQGTIIGVINNLVVSPAIFAIVPITAIDIVLGKKDKKLMLLTFCVMLIKLLGEGGRVQLLYFIIHIVVAFIFGYDKKNIINVLSRKKNKFKIIVLILLLTVIIVFASLSRAGEGLKAFTYYYFSMQPTMFEQWTAKAGDLKGYGEASLNGILFPVLYVLTNLFGIKYPSHWSEVYNLIQATDSEWLVIAGKNISANAYVSMFWYFYLDARKIGVIIFSLLYGAFCGEKYSNMIKNLNARSLCLFSYVIQGILFSFVRFQFANFAYALGYIYICLVGYKRKRRGE